MAKLAYQLRAPPQEQPMTFDNTSTKIVRPLSPGSAMGGDESEPGVVMHGLGRSSKPFDRDMRDSYREYAGF